MITRLKLLLLLNPYLCYLIIMVLTLILKMKTAHCDWTDWNPGKYLLSEPISEPSGKEMPQIYPEIVRDLAGYLICDPNDQTTSSSSSPSSSPLLSSTDDQSPSPTDLEPIIDNAYADDILFNLGSVLITTEAIDIPKTTLEFVRQFVPPALLCEDPDTMSKNSLLNQYLDSAYKQTALDNESAKTMFITLRTGAIIYNELIFNNIDYTEHKDYIDTEFITRCMASLKEPFPE